MTFSSLESLSYDEIIACFNKAFENYFVPMPTDVSFWENRFKNARVNLSFSWGAFQDDKLVGFVINAIDLKKGIPAAYNTGTGVIPDFRGNKLVDKMFEFGMRNLKNHDIQKCSLEVIDENIKAIKAYERIGFENKIKLHCYKGNLTKNTNAIIKESNILEIESESNDLNYSWDNTLETIRKAGNQYKFFKVFDSLEKNYLGYFIIDTSSGYIAQLESKTKVWSHIFDGISQLNSSVRINNVREDRKDLIKYLNILNFDNTIDQIEMEMDI